MAMQTVIPWVDNDEILGPFYQTMKWKMMSQSMVVDTLNELGSSPKRPKFQFIVSSDVRCPFSK